MFMSVPRKSVYCFKSLWGGGAKTAFPYKINVCYSVKPGHCLEKYVTRIGDRHNWLRITSNGGLSSSVTRDLVSGKHLIGYILTEQGGL
jgi:hypothetical protein